MAEAAEPLFDVAVFDNSFSTEFAVPQSIDVPSNGQRVTLALGQHEDTAKLAARILVAFYISSMPHEQLERQIDQMNRQLRGVSTIQGIQVQREPALRRVAAKPDLSKDTHEVVTRALAGN